MNKKFFTGSKVSSENALFQNHVSNYSNYLYDQNFIWLKKEPSTLELDDINTKFMSKWLNDSPLFKFEFKPSAKFIATLESKGFFTEQMLIFTIPSSKLVFQESQNFEISKVTTNTLDKFLEVKFNQDIIYGEEFANINKNFLLSLFKEGILDIFIATLNQKVIGFVNVIKHNSNIEIYDIYTLPKFRNRYVATALQQYVGKFYNDTTIVVIADYADTPKEMYAKLGYEISGSFYQAQKYDK
ncbi:GNAT family N-acetyltransferase [Enterococcus hirae]|uniref:GNAT family N-acetyltransferase n=1 Tax=Enterococcus hirae TaxID=1354 RepID=UPI001A979A91|nr:GNAT family N-acetyltransferase [Enterococcus hirae]MEB7517240.1 GNAT family N-acetyltransferase [Enterococcus hirae]